MQTHEDIMNVYFLFKEELSRKEEFRKNIDEKIKDFDYYTVKNMTLMEEKSDIVMHDILLEMAKKSLSKTPIYYHLEKEDIMLFCDLINEDFDDKYYHISNYHNLLLDFSMKFWTVKPEYEKVMSLLIEKSLEHSVEDTKKTLENIKEWRKPWKNFIEKQILYYKLNESLSYKREDMPKRKI